MASESNVFGTFSHKLGQHWVKFPSSSVSRRCWARGRAKCIHARAGMPRSRVLAHVLWPWTSFFTKGKVCNLGARMCARDCVSRWRAPEANARWSRSARQDFRSSRVDVLVLVVRGCKLLSPRTIDTSRLGRQLDWPLSGRRNGSAPPRGCQVLPLCHLCGRQKIEIGGVRARARASLRGGGSTA